MKWGGRQGTLTAAEAFSVTSFVLTTTLLNRYITLVSSEAPDPTFVNSSGTWDLMHRCLQLASEVGLGMKTSITMKRLWKGSWGAKGGHVECNRFGGRPESLWPEAVR